MYVLIPRSEIYDHDHRSYRLQPILISRFLINLRQAAAPDNDTAMESMSKFSITGLHLSTMLGNMGEPLALGTHEADESSNGGGSNDDISSLRVRNREEFTHAPEEATSRDEHGPQDNVSAALVFMMLRSLI